LRQFLGERPWNASAGLRPAGTELTGRVVRRAR